MRLLKPTLLSMIASALVLAGQATVVTREGTGEAAVLNHDSQKAFEEAREAALRQAVEQAAGVRIDADTLVVNNQLVRDQVFANTSGYVKKYEVVSKKEEKGVATVVVKAEVITDHLDQDIKAAQDLVRRSGRPSLVILMQEQTFPAGGGAVFNSNTLATVLTEAFKADGWDVKDPAFAAGKVRVAPGVTLKDGEAKEIGDLTKANFILYGSAVFQQHRFNKADGGGELMLQGADIFPVSGEFELSLFSTGNGAQIAKVADALKFDTPAGLSKSLISYERTAMELTKARRDVVVGAVRRGVLEYLRNQLVNGTQIGLTVSGLSSFGAARDFTRALKAIKGMREATQDTFSKGTATYRLTFLGTPQDLAERVEQATFKRKKLEVTAVTASAVEVSVGR